MNIFEELSTEEKQANKGNEWLRALEEESDLPKSTPVKRKVKSFLLNPRQSKAIGG